MLIIYQQPKSKKTKNFKIKTTILIVEMNSKQQQ
jgi:hypothetical protein